MSSKNDLNIKKILGTLPLFSGLSKDYLGELVGASRCVSFEKDQAVYRAGDPPNKIYVLLSGQVKIALLGNRGNERIIDVIETGQTFGDAELFGVHPYRTCALAIEPSRVLCVGGEDFCNAMAMDLNMSLCIINKLAKQQIELEVEAAAYHYCSSSQRLLHHLLSLADPNDDLAAETAVTLPFSKQLLASRLDMQPESLSRILTNLSRSGLISVKGRRIGLKNLRIAKYLANEAPIQPIILPDRRWLLRSTKQSNSGTASRSRVESRNGNSASCGDSINKAGRQRMLSQRMAKLWLMLERGVLARRARVVLNQSVALFDSQLKVLGTTAAGVAGYESSAELDRLWKQYRALLESKPSSKGAHQLFSMNEAVLNAAQALTLSFEDCDGTHQGKLVNLAGRQRMLSQRMAKLFMFRQMNIEVRKCRSELEIAEEEFSSALSLLSSTAQGKPRIVAELEQAAEHWRALQSAMARQQDASSSASARMVCTFSEHLLVRMDTAVELYLRLPA